MKKKKKTKNKTKSQSKKDKANTATFVSLLLDESGSMGTCLDSTIASFNEYLKGLKDKKYGDVLFTFTKFEGLNVTIVHDAVKISTAKELNRDTYVPGGFTPLHDAIGRTIRSMEKVLKGLESKPTPLVVIMTDGHENASKEYDGQAIKSLIEDKKKDGWTFMFVGATADAIQTGSSLGIAGTHTMHYSPQLTEATVRTMSAATGRVRESVSKGVYVANVSGTFLSSERDAAVNPDEADDKKKKKEVVTTS